MLARFVGHLYGCSSAISLPVHAPHTSHAGCYCLGSQVLAQQSSQPVLAALHYKSHTTNRISGSQTSSYCFRPVNCSTYILRLGLATSQICCSGRRVQLAASCTIFNASIMPKPKWWLTFRPAPLVTQSGASSPFDDAASVAIYCTSLQVRSGLKYNHKK